MSEDGQNRDIYIGDDKILEITILDEAGAALNLTGAAITWILARTAGGAAVLTKTIGSGITVATPASGVIQVALTDTETAALSRSYWHQVVVTDAAGLKSTVMTGELNFKPRVQ